MATTEVLETERESGEVVLTTSVELLNIFDSIPDLRILAEEEAKVLLRRVISDINRKPTSQLLKFKRDSKQITCKRKSLLYAQK